MGTIHLLGRPVEIAWPTRQRLGSVASRARTRGICQVILHHDACTSAEACIRVLANRKLGTHFIIDNDGTILQCLDPIVSTADHARGLRPDGVWCGYNDRSIGIDISNAVLPSHAKRYMPRRKLVSEYVQGGEVKGLAPYEIQLDAVFVLLELLRREIPTLGDNSGDDAHYLGFVEPSTPGIWGHCQISPQKIDPFAFPWPRLAAALGRGVG